MPLDDFLIPDSLNPRSRKDALYNGAPVSTIPGTSLKPNIMTEAGRLSNKDHTKILNDTSDFALGVVIQAVKVQDGNRILLELAGHARRHQLNPSNLANLPTEPATDTTATTEGPTGRETLSGASLVKCWVASDKYHCGAPSIEGQGTAPDPGLFEPAFYALTNQVPNPGDIVQIKYLTEEPYGSGIWMPQDNIASLGGQALNSAGGLNTTGAANYSSGYAQPAGTTGQIPQDSDVKSTALAGALSTFKEVFQHNLAGEQGQRAEFFASQLIRFGITNKYLIVGALAAAGKESNFMGVAEKPYYGYERLLSSNAAVRKRTQRVFQHQLGRDPTPAEWKALSTSAPDKLKAGIALFNIAYGYEPIKGKNRYTSYQLDEAIKHPSKKHNKGIPVVTKKGVINPKLYNAKLAGYKYRGRGPIQLTFKSNYKLNGEYAKRSAPEVDVKKLLENPDWMIEDPKIGIILCAAFIARAAGKSHPWKTLAKQGIEKGNPKTLLQGVLAACLLVGGGGAPTHTKSGKAITWYARATRNALGKANKHLRVVSKTTPAKPGEVIV